jgi:hypothetical protein
MFNWLFKNTWLKIKKVYFIEREMFYPNQIKVSSTYIRSDNMLEYKNLYSTKTFDNYLDAVRYGNRLAKKYNIFFLDQTVE